MNSEMSKLTKKEMAILHILEGGGLKKMQYAEGASFLEIMQMKKKAEMNENW